MDTSRNRTWLRRMASLLWLVFLFVGVSAGTLEKLHEGELVALCQPNSSYYIKRRVLNKYFQSVPRN